MAQPSINKVVQSIMDGEKTEEVHEYKVGRITKKYIEVTIHTEHGTYKYVKGDGQTDEDIKNFLLKQGRKVEAQIKYDHEQCKYDEGRVERKTKHVKFMLEHKHETIRLFSKEKLDSKTAELFSKHSVWCPRERFTNDRNAQEMWDAYDMFKQMVRNQNNSNNPKTEPQSLRYAGLWFFFFNQA